MVLLVFIYSFDSRVAIFSTTTKNNPSLDLIVVVVFVFQPSDFTDIWDSSPGFLKPLSWHLEIFRFPSAVATSPGMLVCKSQAKGEMKDEI